MSEISNKARLRLHDIMSATGSFTVPPQEDITVTGTMSWSPRDLKDKEIGVLYTQNKLQVRIGSNINTIAFQTGGATGGLESVLAVDNETGTYNIIMGTGTNIGSLNGDAELRLDYLSQPNTVLLSTDGGSLAQTYLQFGTTSYQIAGPSGQITYDSGRSSITRAGNGIAIVDNTTATASSDSGSNQIIFIGTDGSTASNNIVNSVVIGGTTQFATQSNTVYVPNLYIQNGKKIRDTIFNNYISLDAAGTGDITISRGTFSSVYMDSGIAISTPSGTIDITANNNINITSTNGTITSTASVENKMLVEGNGILILDNTTATASSPTENTQGIFIGTNGSSLSPGVTNSVVIGGSNLIGTQSNTVYMQNLFVQGDFATATPAIKTSDDGTVRLYNVIFATGSGVTFENILTVGNDPNGQMVGGTFGVYNYQGEDIMTYTGAMNAGATAFNGVITPYSAFRQRAGTFSGATGSVDIETFQVDGNGSVMVSGHINIMNYDWSTKYGCHFNVTCLGGGTLTHSVTSEIQNYGSGFTFSATASNFYIDGGGNLIWHIEPKVAGTTWYVADYKVFYLSIPV